MKKILSLILALGLLFSLAACAAEPEEGVGEEPAAGESAETAAPIDAVPVPDILSLFQDMTDVGLDGCLRKTLTAENAGLEMGYADFAGEFDSAMALAPAMISNPFVLIVFRLAEGADASAFAADIEQHADPQKWVCVWADKVFTRVSGRTVLFVMCAEELEKPISDCFEEMVQEGFDPAEHMVDPLAGKNAHDIYNELLELFSAEEYGFMDNAHISDINADTPYGLSGLDVSKAEETVFDEGFVARNDEDGDKAYLFSIIRLKEGESAGDFAESVKNALDTSAMQGEYAECMSAWAGPYVIVYAGTGTYGISATSLASYLAITYRMSTDNWVNE